MRHQRFLHISRVPLDQAPVDRVQPREHIQGSVLDAVFEQETVVVRSPTPGAATLRTAYAMTIVVEWPPCGEPRDLDGSSRAARG